MNTPFFKILCAALLLCAPFARSLAQDTFLIECESFQFTGDWRISDYKRHRILGASDTRSEPMTVFAIKKAGKYFVWACAPDFPPDEKPGSRRFRVLIDEKKLPDEAGRHGKDGFYWELLGERELEKGEHLLTLQNASSFPRCDAVLFTTNPAFNPNVDAADKTLRNRLRRRPVEIPADYVTDFPYPEALQAAKGGKVFSIENADVKMTFTQKRDSAGKMFYERSAELKRGGRALKPDAFASEALLLIYSTNPKCSERSYFVSWGESKAKVKVDLNGKRMELPVSPTNPYAVGDVKALRPIDVKKTDAKTLELTYEGGVAARMRLADSGAFAKFEVKVKADKKGFYSFGFLGFNPTQKENFDALELPTLYQMRRTMDTPKMVSNNMTSQPLALVQKNLDDKTPFTYGFVADPMRLPFDWSRGGSSIYGFSISGPKNEIQPAIFQPILGSIGSEKNEGDTLEASWYVLNIAGNWADALELANEKIFDGSRLREAYDVSFSDSVANIAAYLKNESASGWSRHLKGRWNIEAEYTATHSSPLSELSVALLTDDEDYYKNIALPSIEFTISRKNAHFSTIAARGTWTSEANMALNVPGMWGADYYVSVNRMLGGANPWVNDLLKHASGSLRMKGEDGLWSTLLGMHIATGDPATLEEAKAACDAWLEKAFDNRDYRDTDVGKFINVSLYPYWWYLPEMYEITGDKKYLRYAELGAFHTLSSLWSYPTPPQGEVVINPGNASTSINSIWWLGRERFRMGRAQNDFVIDALRKAPDADRRYFTGVAILPEKKVEAMKVSRIGLGIEQHTTYMQGATNGNNILMPSWAAEMLKVYQYTKRDIIMKYSRHSIIGRYSNFLGYYVRDFIDVQHDPEYPYKGPDITSFYYHHAPCHFGQSMDYLMAQLELATDNRIKFPYVRQQGYVWFTDRIFGLPGKVFDDPKAKPILDKSAVGVDSAKISTMLARGKNSIWVMLLNDSGSELSTEVRLNPSARGMKGAKADGEISLYNAKGEKLPQTFAFFGDKRVSIPAMGLVALRIPAEDFEVERKLPAIGGESHIVKRDVAKGWGDLHLFRIRGPFGKDSIYAVFTGGLGKEGAKVALKLPNSANAEIVVDRYPYEFSVYPLPMGEDVPLEIRIEEAGRPVAEIKDIKLGK